MAPTARSSSSAAAGARRAATPSPKVRLPADAAFYYPSARGNRFLKGGIGASQVAFTGPGPDGTGFGFGTVLGAGDDWRLGRKSSLTPQFTIFGGRTGDIEDDDGTPIANDLPRPRVRARLAA